jgi:hypothetical protein
LDCRTELTELSKKPCGTTIDPSCRRRTAAVLKIETYKQHGVAWRGMATPRHAVACHVMPWHGSQNFTVRCCELNDVMSQSTTIDGRVSQMA